MSKEYDYLFKLVIVGNSGVGKSSLLMRYSDDTFSDTYLATIGVDFKFKTVLIDGKKVKQQIWDTAGQERFRTITSAYYKGADAIVMVYDSTNASSFTDIDRFWINEVESYADKDVEILLLANKSDLTAEKRVDETSAKEYSGKRNMEFFEVSAKTAEGVGEAFATIARKLMEKKKNKVQDKINKRKGKPTTTGKEEEVPEKIKLGGGETTSNNDIGTKLADKFKKLEGSCCQ